MENAITQQEASGIWTFDINDEILVANKLYGTIYGNVVTLQGSRWYSGEGFDLRVDLLDNSPGNEQQDLPANGLYEYPLTSKRIQVSYNGIKNNQPFHVIGESGEITICLDPTKLLYFGHLNIQFTIDGNPVNIKSSFGIEIR